MKISANIATYPPRLDSLKLTVASLYDQVDEIRICFNEIPGETILSFFYHLKKIIMIFPKTNLTDNGKFCCLDVIKDSEYYFTCDDDLIYPPDYVAKTIEAIETYGTIITYHGRILKGTGKDYYRGHKAYQCLADQKGNHRIDVAGTGVTAFDTRYFHPKGLANHEHQKMSDLVFSLEAAKQGKQIGCIEHKQGWIKHIDHAETIHGTEGKTKTPIQNGLADEIYKLNYGI